MEIYWENVSVIAKIGKENKTILKNIKGIS